MERYYSKDVQGKRVCSKICTLFFLLNKNKKMYLQIFSICYNVIMMNLVDDEFLVKLIRLRCLADQVRCYCCSSKNDQDKDAVLADEF